MPGLSENIQIVAAFIQRGGAINWVITGFYLVVIVLSVERAAFFLRSAYRRKTLFARMDEFVSEERDDLSRFWSSQYLRSQPIHMVHVFMANRSRATEVLNEVLDREGEFTRAEMERGLEALSVIGSIAPLAGLLGTVTGLIRTFTEIEAMGGTVDIAAFSGGIWEAMITTATGLAVAIPAIIICRTFERFVEVRSRDMSYVVSILMERFREDLLGCVDIETDASTPASGHGKHSRETA